MRRQHTVVGFFDDNWQVFAETVEAENGEQAARTALQRLVECNAIEYGAPVAVAVIAGEVEVTHLFEHVVDLNDLNVALRRKELKR